jgi:hypothetical protein
VVFFINTQSQYEEVTSVDMEALAFSRKKEKEEKVVSGPSHKPNLL